MSAPRSFRVSTQITGELLWWWVRIYDTDAQLQDAAHQHHPWYGRRHWDGTAGAHQPGPFREQVTGDGKWMVLKPPNGLLGVIRLSRQQLTYAAVVHEATHAALYAYRVTQARHVRLGDECGPREELLCYLTGELADSIFATL